MTVESSFDHWSRFVDDLSELHLEVTRHPLFSRSWSMEDLRTVMQWHVVAVWDFMALAKTLQQRLTVMQVPWLPPSDPEIARMINEIILAEESDHIESLGFTGSHMELYLAAMDEIGASTVPMEGLLGELAMGTPVAQAMILSGLPAGALKFARNTLSVCQRNTHEVAAAFLMGREAIIPVIFRSMLPLIPEAGTEYFRAYLDRHILVDATQHGPMAEKIFRSLCGQVESRWREAFDAAASSLAARRRLWDDVEVALNRCANEPSDLLDFEESMGERIRTF